MTNSGEQGGAVEELGLRPACDHELPAVVSLLNRAYRGAEGEASWNSEAGYIDGDRTNEPLLRQELADSPDGRLLVSAPNGVVRACVWLEPLGQGVWYLGSLAVDPRMQSAGLGRRLLNTAEGWVRNRGGRAIRMTVVNVRDTLIAWYARRGYAPTGETEPFPYSDPRFGVPRRSDLSFVVLMKRL